MLACLLASSAAAQTFSAANTADLRGSEAAIAAQAQAARDLRDAQNMLQPALEPPPFSDSAPHDSR